MDEFMSALDPAMVVVTAAAGRERDGCLVGFSTQCSIHPLRLVVCLSMLNRTYELARAARGLAVHALGAQQRPLAAHFGSLSGDTVDKLAGLEWREGTTGAPVLHDCAAWLEGWIEGRVPLGDHVGYVLAPVAGGRGPCDGSLRLSDTIDLRAGHPADEKPGEAGPERPSGL